MKFWTLTVSFSPLVSVWEITGEAQSNTVEMPDFNLFDKFNIFAASFEDW